MSKNTSHNKVQVVQKDAEFEAFITAIGEGELPETWELMAEALGVHRNTITRWKQQPQFQAALAKGIRRATEQMEAVGKRDWRMWRERASMLMKEKKDATVNINADKVIAILGGETTKNVQSDNGNEENT